MQEEKTRRGLFGFFRRFRFRRRFRRRHRKGRRFKFRGEG